MFTNDDYINYFNEIEDIFKNTIVIYTDLVNEISDQAIRNRLLVLASENMDIFNFITEIKNKYFESA